MSLIRIAARMCLVEALKDNTLAAGNVLDSAIGAFQVKADGSLRTDQDGPFLAIYTDAAKSTPNGLRGLTANGDTDILIETGVTAAMAVENDDGEGEFVQVGIPETDASYDYLIDLIMHQVTIAINDPENPFAQLFISFVCSVKSVEIARVGNANDGVKLAGRQVKLRVELIDDPEIGQPLATGIPFDNFLTTFEASTDATQVAKASAMRAMVTGQDDDLKATQRYLGLTADEMQKLGLAPLVLNEEGSTPVVTEATIEIDGRDPEIVTDD